MAVRWGFFIAASLMVAGWLHYVGAPMIAIAGGIAVVAGINLYRARSSRG